MSTPSHNPDWVIIAKIGKTTGLDGSLFLNLFSDIPENISEFFVYGTDWQPIDVVITGSQRAKIQVQNFDSKESARVWTNKYIAIKRSALPKPNADEYYWHDLIGMQVINSKRKILGTVEDIKDFGAQANLMVKKNNQQSEIIPLLKDFIIEKDFSKRIIIVNWD